MLSWLAHFIERHPVLHRTSLAVWRRFPPRLAGFLRTLLTTRWAVGAVAVIIDEEVNSPEVLLVTTDPRVQALGLLRRYARQEQLHHFYILSDPVTELDRSGLRR